MDERQFWLDHDAALPGREALSHDLYRGMPGWFNAFFAHFQRRAVARLLAQCGALDGKWALDIGCGTGRWSALMADLGARPVGVDLGFRAVQYAAARQPCARFAAACLPPLPFGDGMFDLAISVTVLQHLSYARQEEAVGAIARVLKPGGFLVACELLDANDPAAHVFGNEAATWRALFEVHGLAVRAQAYCEYLPIVKGFQRWRARVAAQRPEAEAGYTVSQVASSLDRRPLLRGALRLGIACAYPLEYAASWVLPDTAARYGAFLCVHR